MLKLSPASSQAGSPIIPEGGSDEGGGRGGVTPRVVAPPHSLPTERATLAPECYGLLAAGGCCGGKKQGCSAGTIHFRYSDFFMASFIKLIQLHP